MAPPASLDDGSGGEDGPSVTAGYFAKSARHAAIEPVLDGNEGVHAEISF